MNTKYLVVPILFFVNEVVSVPPEACFANFNWDDCGKPPVPVMYYWKPGSRCEVGYWRGCLPNINMFQDEYECVSTCIFTIRAMAEDYHNLLVPQDEEIITSPPMIETTPEVTEAGNGTATTAGDGDAAETGGAAAEGEGGSGTGGTTGANPTT